MTAELFTVATKATPGLERLQTSLAKFGVAITILGQNEPDYWGHGWKWKTFVRATKASTADVAIHCDAYDSVCLGPLADLVTKFTSLAHPLVFSYEPQAQPEFWLALNSGLLMADRTTLLNVFTDQTLDEFFPDHFNDQYQLQSMYSWNPAAFKLDQQGVLFHTLGPLSVDLVAKDKRLVNPVTGLAHSFVHAPNTWNMAIVDQWLASLN